MFCTNCGAKIQEGARFCSSCGTRLNIAPAGQQGAPRMGQQVPQQMGQQGAPRMGQQVPQQMGQQGAPRMGQQIPPQMGQQGAPRMGQQVPPQMQRGPVPQGMQGMHMAQGPNGTIPYTPVYRTGPSVPWHSRGKNAPDAPGAKGRTILFIALLFIAQLVLYFILVAIFSGDDSNGLFAQIIGLIPTVLLIIFLYRLDAVEKEPRGLLIKLFVIEAIVTVTVVTVAEWLLCSLAEILFSGVLLDLIENLLCVALIEELGKYLVLKACTWKHKAFNYSFDGILYAAITAIGFAAIENVFYIMDYGMEVAVARVFTAVPGHCVDGILMGIFYGRAKLYEARGDAAKSKRFRRYCLLAPIVEHGIYDFMAGNAYVNGFLFSIYIFLLYAVVFVLVWRLAQKDEPLYIYRPGYVNPAFAMQGGMPGIAKSE